MKKEIGIVVIATFLLIQIVSATPIENLSTIQEFPDAITAGSTYEASYQFDNTQPINLTIFFNVTNEQYPVNPNETFVEIRLNNNLLNSTEISGGIFKCEELSISQIGTNTVNVNLSSRIDLQPSEDYEFELGLWIIYEFEEEIVEERIYIRGRGGGGGGVAAPKMNVPVDPVTGAVTSTTTLSADGATLTIPEGTIVKDEEGNILSTPIFMLHTPTTAETVGAIKTYEFGPSGMTFEPPIDLVIAYDPADIPEGFSESDLVIRMWDGTAWIDLETIVDTTAHTATAKVSHFTIFALFATPAVAPPPTPTPVVTPSPTATPTATPTPIKEFPLIPIVVIVAIVVVAIFVAYVWRGKK